MAVTEPVRIEVDKCKISSQCSRIEPTGIDPPGAQQIDDRKNYREAAGCDGACQCAGFQMLRFRVVTFSGS